MIGKLPIIISIVVVVEIGLMVRARYEAWRREFPSVPAMWFVLHVLLVAAAFRIAGAVLVYLTRFARLLIFKSNALATTADVVGIAYGNVHGRLVKLLALVLTNLRKLNAKKTRTKRISHTPLALWTTNPTVTAAHSDSSSSNTEHPVSDLHGRVVHIILGLAAGTLMAAFAWLFGLYRWPSSVVTSTRHLGPLPLTAIFIIVFGLVLGVVANLASEDRGSIDDGFAKRRDVRRSVSANAVRRSARITRPGFAARQAPVHHSGVLLGRYKGRRIWASIKDIILVIAPPQTGKTAYLGGRIIDAPGAVVATSTKADIHYYTAELRAARARVWVLNPEGLGDIVTNFRWDPLEGCTDPDIASERAGYLLSGTETGPTEDRFWHDMNVKLLRCLLMAAALDERNLRDVLAWVNDSADTTALRIMQDDDRAPREWVAELNQLRYDTPERTRQSVHLTLARSMQFVTLPSVAAAVCPKPGERVFNLDDFLTAGETLYLLGSDRPHASIAPLFTAIVGYIFEGAKRRAGRTFHGRLPDPLSLILDEVKLICPVPLPSMTADCGGRGIQLTAAVQSPSQLYERWGERGGQTIVNNANAKIVFGGLGHAKDLEDLSRLCGNRDDRTRQMTTGNNGHHSASVHVRQVPVLAPHEVRQIPEGKALLLYRNVAPMIVATERVWDRKDVKAMLKARRRVPVQRFEPVTVDSAESVEVPAETAAEIVQFPARNEQDEGVEARAEGEN